MSSQINSNNFSLVEIEQINQHLNRGDKSAIAQEMGVTLTYVSRVLDIEDDSYNDEILDHALTIALRNREVDANLSVSKIERINRLNAIA